MAQQGVRSPKCKTCQHPDCLRADYLVAQNVPIVNIAKEFGLSPFSVARHAKRHISPAFISSVRVGPYASEERLRALCADSGVSVLETLKAMYAPLAARYMIAFQGGADSSMIALAGKMRVILMDQAKLTQELAPQPASVSLTQNILLQPGWFEGFSQKMVEFARRHPEVREDLMEVLREGVSGSSMPLLNVTPAEDDAAA